MNVEATNKPAPLEPNVNTLKGIRKYVLATRPPFLSAAVVPVVLGVATAHAAGVMVDLILALLTVLGAVCIHAGINVLNDYYDALNGTDAINEERVYPFTGGSRFIQNGLLSPRQTAAYGRVLLGVGAAIGIGLTLAASVDLFWIGLAGLVVGWGYSAPPLRLNSRGLGELSVGLGFGILIPLGADMVQREVFSWLPVLVGIPYGLLITNLLYINQFPDRRADEACGKHHWVVRLGPERAPWGYLFFGSLSYLWLVILVAGVGLSAWVLLGLVSLPLSLIAVRELFRHARQPSQLATAIRLTILAGMIQGVLLSGVMFLV